MRNSHGSRSMLTAMKIFLLAIIISLLSLYFFSHPSLQDHASGRDNNNLQDASLGTLHGNNLSSSFHFNISQELIIWTSDFHISTVYDIKYILKQYNVRLIDKSLSGHCHLTNTCQYDLHVINRENGIELSPCPNRLRRKFYEYYKDDLEFQSVDAFLCTHASSMCELYMPFGKPIIIVASTRFEIGRHQIKRWQNWIINLRKIASHVENTVAANNEYDREYLRYFTGLPSSKIQLLGSLCDYPGVSYNPIRSEILIGPSRGINSIIGNEILRLSSLQPLFYNGRPIEIHFLRDIYPHYEYVNLSHHPAVILIPYQVSFMLFFELYSMFIPMFVPSPELLVQWHLKYGILSERTWDRVFGNPMNSSAIPRHSELQDISDRDNHLNYDPNSEFHLESILEWIKFSDFYRFQHVMQFTSLDHLHELLSSPTLKNNLDNVSANMKIFHQQRSRQVHAGWMDVLTKIQNYRQRKTFETSLSGDKYHLRSSQADINVVLRREYGLSLSENCIDQYEV